MIQLEPWQWVIAIFGAFNFGIAKTGFPGVGILMVAMFAMLLPPVISVGVVLPVLICADIMAVIAYRKHAVWGHLLRLFPWTALGTLIGYFAMSRINAKYVAPMIGCIVFSLAVLQLWRSRNMPPQPAASESASLDAPPPEAFAPSHPALIIMLGLLAGFTTMVANAAGPLMVLYLLSLRLPKIQFLGTSAWYFLIVNSSKVPLSFHLEMMSFETLLVSLALAPGALLGAVVGRDLVKRVDQKLFENIALFFTFVAGFWLMIPRDIFRAIK